MLRKNWVKSLIWVGMVVFCWVSTVTACTGIRLLAGDGGSVYGRSMEWGAFDLNSRVAVVPRGYRLQGLTPEGKNGRGWKAKYGVVGLDMLGKDLLGDGMNEKGLTAGLFYHPGTARYMAYNPKGARNTITAVDIVSFILTQYATLDEVRKGMAEVRVVPVIEEALGIPVQGHWMVTDASGAALVIEYINGKVTFFDNPLGVITNSPTYDWHMTNLRNYINLSSVALPTKAIEEMDFSPMGAGSGMMGLPGDFTPPSRFIRAVAWSQTARPTADSTETVYELFRILDNFNLPLGGAEGSDNQGVDTSGMRSATIWTTAWDQDKKVLYFHTQHNRRVRKVDFSGVDFTGKAIVHIAMDREKRQDIEDLTPNP